jgi:hypothetical protein
MRSGSQIACQLSQHPKVAGTFAVKVPATFLTQRTIVALSTAGMPPLVVWTASNAMTDSW